MLLTQEFEAVPVGDLSLHPDNPRRGDVDIISASIKAHGFFGACVAQRSTGRILVGNHRWIAAQAAGEDQVPVLWLDVDDEQAKRIMVADNRTAELAQWDEAALASVLEELSLTPGGLDGLAFSEDDLAALISMRDETGEGDGDGDGDRTMDVLNALNVTIADPNHQVKHGEIYTLAGAHTHRLIIGKVTTDWPIWARYLDGDAVFCAHPSPFLPLSTLADERPLVMVTSSTYLAGHLLDKWVYAGNAEPTLEHAAP